MSTEMRVIRYPEMAASVGAGPAGPGRTADTPSFTSPCQNGTSDHAGSIKEYFSTFLNISRGAKSTWDGATGPFLLLLHALDLWGLAPGFSAGLPASSHMLFRLIGG